MSIVEMSGVYAYSDFPILSEKIHKQANEIMRTNELILNLQDITFIDPFGMISIVGACRHVYNTYKVCTLVQLPQGSAGSYMERASFKDLQDKFLQTTRKKNFGDFLRMNENIGVLRFFKSEKDIKPLNSEVEHWLLKTNFQKMKSEVYLFLFLKWFKMWSSIAKLLKMGIMHPKLSKQNGSFFGLGDWRFRAGY